MNYVNVLLSIILYSPCLLSMSRLQQLTIGKDSIEYNQAGEHVHIQRSPRRDLSPTVVAARVKLAQLPPLRRDSALPESLQEDEANIKRVAQGISKQD